MHRNYTSLSFHTNKFNHGEMSSGRFILLGIERQLETINLSCIKRDFVLKPMSIKQY